MTRLNKELRKGGIICDADDMMIAMHSMEYDMDEKLVAISGDYIITLWSSAVMDSEFHIYDRHTLKPIGGQDVRPSFRFDGSKTWGSFGYVIGIDDEEEVA